MIRRTLLATAAIALLGTAAAAQSTVNGTATINVPSIASLSSSATTTAFTHPGNTAFDALSVDTIVVNPTSNASLKVVANRDWTLSVKSAASWTFTNTFSLPTTAPKATTDLLVQTTDAVTPWQGIDPTDRQILTGTRGRSTVSPGYKLIVRLADDPGAYVLDVTYTLTTP